MEEEVLKLWKEIDAFQTSLKKSEGRPEFSFYDGPPFATGLPHYGHILAGTIKDTVCRYAHATGHHVTRRFGWDCHGLPIEFEIDRALGIKTRQAVLDFGIPNYNAECRKIVMRFSSEWEEIVTRLGRWIDFKNDYKTMEPWYMESIWWVFKQLFDKDLVYRGFKVMPFSTACATPLSNFEANQAYQDTDDPEVYVFFPLEDDPDTKLIAWTTTPWTLPSNLALCVSPTMTYLKVKDLESGTFFIVAEKLIDNVFPKTKKKKKAPPAYEVIESFVGTDLQGKRYVPLFNYFESFRESGAFTVLCDSYVKDSSGTGVVHQAPAFGEDDYRCCLAAGIIEKGVNLPCPVDANGIFTEEVSDFQGQYVKDADVNIIIHLKGKNRVLRNGKVNHSYPFCWRSDTPLIYKAVSSWFVNVTEVKDRLIKNNEETYWVPRVVKEKRFHNWLSGAIDWNVSRNRFWGTPLPLWVNEDFSEVVCIGSIDELEQLSGVRVTDLHRESVDHIVIQGKSGPLHRVEEVFDCWFESGSMPYAQLHYPFENKDFFHDHYFPSTFIAEGIDQTRGWFYTLLVLSTCLFDKPAFQNLIVNGMVLAEDGKKMSKRLRNYPDPTLVVAELGADALRLYLLNSPAVRGDDLRFRSEGVKEVIRETLLPLYNIYRFLIQSMIQRTERTGESFQRNAAAAAASTNTMDKWILSVSQTLVANVRRDMKGYRLYKVGPRLVEFVEELRNWYVRFNRKRLRGNDGEEECLSAISTLYEALLVAIQLLVPFTPFFCEHVYQNLRHALPEESREESVHYLMMPEAQEQLNDSTTEQKVKHMQSVITLGRAARDRKNRPLKFPLKSVTIIHSSEQALAALQTVEEYIADELNVCDVVFSQEEAEFVQLQAQGIQKVLGAKLRGDKKKVMAAIAAMSHQEIKAFEAAGQGQFEGYTILLEEVEIVRTFRGDEEKQVASWDNNVLIVLDLDSDPELFSRGVARTIVNRIQKKRKEANLSPSDSIDVHYSVTEPEDGQVQSILRERTDEISAALDAPFIPLVAGVDGSIKGVFTLFGAEVSVVLKLA